MKTTADTLPEVEVAIVGAGFSGIGTAIKLDRAGFRDWALIEEGSGVGGAWYWNTYPGIGVDIPSFSYQFSFEQRSDWSRVYAKGEELRGYAEDCVDRYGLRSRIRFDSKVVSASYDEEGHFWHLGIAEGPALSARHLVGATGVFSQPKPLDIPGLDDFAGQVMHTARWDHDVDLAGQAGRDRRHRRLRRAGDPGDRPPGRAPHRPAADADLVPAEARRADPAGGEAHPRAGAGAGRGARALSQAYVELTFPIAAHYHRTLKLASIGERQAPKGLRTQVQDPVVREKLTPRYGLGCKRVSFSNEYLPTFNRDNVHLETSPIERFTAGSVRTEEAEHAIDVLILATGFKAFEKGNMPPYPVAGRGGVDLGEWWDENRFQAYEGVSVPGFPNMFMILGPYGYNGSSYFTLIEHQARHIVRCLTRARETGTTEIEVTADANRRYWESMFGRRGRQVFFSGTCGTANSYYFDAHGDVPFRPASTPEAAWRSGHFPLQDYRFTRSRRPVTE